MLGSIKDLQLRFSQAGLVEHRPGAGAGVKASLDTLGEDEETENRPPGPSSMRGKERKPWKDVEMPRMDPASARKEARSLARRMRSMWDLQSPPSPSTPASPHTPLTPIKREKEKDTRSMLIHTAQAVRRARTLALSAGPSRLMGTSETRRMSTPAVGTLRPMSKPRSSFSTPSRPHALPRAVSLGHPERKSSLGPSTDVPDPITSLRRAALDVLSNLRILEEKLRVVQVTGSPSTTFIVAARDQTASPTLLSDSGGTTRDLDASHEQTPPSSFRPLSSASGTSGMYSEPEIYGYDDDEEYNFNALAQDEETKHTFTWEERIIAEDREYRQLSDESWEEEGSKIRDAAQKWIGVVEQIFAIDSTTTSLPAWAEQDYEGTERQRIYEFLEQYLPSDLKSTLPPCSADWMSALTDGYILIRAFNNQLATSTKAWGAIPEEDIHDTLSASASSSPEKNDEARRKAEGEWTFRRIGNLTCWAAALRLRYSLPISLPNSAFSSTLSPMPSSLPRLTNPSLSPNPGHRALLPNPAGPPQTPHRGTRDEESIKVDPAVIARQGQSWNEMLYKVLVRWVDAAAREIRQELGQ